MRLSSEISAKCLHTYTPKIEQVNVMTMSKKRKFSVVISLVFCMSILFSGTVFASGDSHEMAIPGDMEVVATITDEFNNVTNVDVEYTIEEVPNRSRAVGAKSYVLRAVTSESASDSGTLNNAGASITIYYQCSETWLPGDAKFRINTVSGSWNANGQTLSDREIKVNHSGDYKYFYPGGNSYSYGTGYTEFVHDGVIAATSSVRVNGGSTLSVSVGPKWIG